MPMPEHILFLTGSLAEPSLHKVLNALQPTPFTFEVHVLGLKVAGLMTADMIQRRLPNPRGADRVLVPGRCRGDLDAVSRHLGVPVQRGPDELKDLPEYFGRQRKQLDLNRHEVRVFAEIVDAPQLSIEEILARAGEYRQEGADVIDLGCLPGTPFAHLEDAVVALRDQGYRVSVDSMDSDELLRGGRAGADYLLSLSADTLWIADSVDSIPVLVPVESGDLDSLYQAMDRLQASGRRFIVDPVIDPIHFGFMDSLMRFGTLRRERPASEIMMGIGNLTELTDADTAGVNAVLMGIVSELRIGNVLTTKVSAHCRAVLREVDLARRLMYAARENATLPRDIHSGLLALHERRPFPSTSNEVAELAASIRDPNFRIQVTDTGVHIYNRDGLWTASDPFQLYPHLKVEHDGAHAFYLGVETARAQIAWQLGKRYNQDEELRWGCAVEPPQENLLEQKPPGSTLTREEPRDRS